MRRRHLTAHSAEGAQVHFERRRLGASGMRLRGAEALITLRLVAVASSKAVRDSYTGINMALSACACLKASTASVIPSMYLRPAALQNLVLVLLRAPSCPCQAVEAAGPQWADMSRSRKAATSGGC
jgi:hypothetical protein